MLGLAESGRMEALLIRAGEAGGSPMLATFRRNRPYAERPGVVEQLAQLDERLAGAAVRAVLAAVYADGLDPIFIRADAGDWPGGWYTRLGFETVRELWEFTREPYRPA